VTDDWPEIVPITEAELQVMEGHFADELDAIFRRTKVAPTYRPILFRNFHDADHNVVWMPSSFSRRSVMRCMATARNMPSCAIGPPERLTSKVNYCAAIASSFLIVRRCVGAIADRMSNAPKI